MELFEKYKILSETTIIEDYIVNKTSIVVSSVEKHHEECGSKVFIKDISGNTIRVFILLSSIMIYGINTSVYLAYELEDIIEREYKKHIRTVKIQSILE